MNRFSYLSFDRSPDTSLLDLFINADELYFIESAGSDWRFGFVSRRLSSSVSVTVGDQALLSGADILLILRAAMLCLPDEEALEAALQDAGIPLHPIKRANWMAPPQPSTQDIAYRTFLSTRDLELLFSFPAQPATAACCRVILADATMTPVPGSPIFLPDAPLVMKFMVVYPVGVRVSERDGVFADAEFTVTYSDPGHEDSPHNVVAGKPSPFLTYYGAAICVQPLSRIGIELKPLPVKITEDVPSGRMITLVLRFTEDRALTSTISVDPQSTEYSLLRAGTWHGYRAKRMVVKCHGDESYLVDLRFSAPPEPESPPQEQGRKPRQGTGKKRRRRRRNPWFYFSLALMALVIGMVVVYFLPSIMPRSNPDFAPGIIEVPRDTVLDAPVINIPVPADTPVAASAPVDTVPEIPADTATQVLSQPTAQGSLVAGMSDADRSYLDSHSVWVRSELNSADAVALFDLFATADLKAIASHPYLADRKCRNSFASKIAVLVWQALGSDTQVSNKRVLKELEGQQSIDLTDLFVKLDKVRSAKPNTRPRP